MFMLLTPPEYHVAENPQFFGNESEFASLPKCSAPRRWVRSSRRREVALETVLVMFDGYETKVTVIVSV